MSETIRGSLAKAIWELIVMTHNQGGRTKVELTDRQVEDALLSLCCVAGNMISNVQSPSDRERFLRTMGPQTEHFVSKIRARPSIHIPSKSPLIVPN